MVGIDKRVSSAGDARLDAFDATLRALDPALRVFVYRLVGRDVDDVLQDTYLAAYRALAGFRGESSMRTWLHSIAFRAALNHLRAGRRWSRWLERDVVFDEDVAGGVASRVDLMRALRGLSVDHRSVLVLVDGQGFSYDQAAIVLGVAAGTVASRLSRARELVRADLQERNVH